MIKAYCKKHRISLKVYNMRKNLVLESIKKGTFNSVKGRFKKDMQELYNTHLLSTYGVL